jgi:hypothetical protein
MIHMKTEGRGLGRGLLLIFFHPALALGLVLDFAIALTLNPLLLLLYLRLVLVLPRVCLLFRQPHIHPPALVALPIMPIRRRQILISLAQIVRNLDVLADTRDRPRLRSPLPCYRSLRGFGCVQCRCL